MTVLRRLSRTFARLALSLTIAVIVFGSMCALIGPGAATVIVTGMAAAVALLSLA